MKRLTLLISVLLGFISMKGYSQNLAVESFTLAPTDMTANLAETMVRDQNGEVCALIKVETLQKGFTFDVGVLGVVSVVEQPAEIWVYVPFGVRKITIQHPQLGIVRDYQIPCAVERGRTYIMKITSGNVRTIVEYAVSRQFLFVQVDPVDAILEIDGKIKAIENGSYQELFPFGKYSYRVQRQNYHDASGVVEISDPDNTHRLSVRLKPAFGYVSVLAGNNSEIKGAAVYIDDKPVGVIPVQNIQLGSGSHNIRVIKPMYEVYNSTFTIADDEQKVVTPNLLPDFAEVTLKSAATADIYINGENKGKGSWKGRLASGSYVFESRQSGHITTKMNYDISRNDQSRTITIQDPIPVYGSLIVSSNPPNAKILINGTYVGDTPKFIGKQVVGEYSVKVEMEGYVAQTKTVTVLEGGETSLDFVLEKGVPVYTSVTKQSSNIDKVTGPINEISETANCYMITKGGTYNFPTVQGNSNVSVGNVASAEVLWETFGTYVTPNVGDLIENVSYSNGYITFTTTSEFKEGNALIAVKDALGKILWSWHIWMTDQPEEHVYYNNAGTMMDRNLGATSAERGDAGAYGLLYQWGRKDPFLGAGAYEKYPKQAKSTGTWPEPVKCNKKTGNISYAISHPTTFILCHKKNSDWYYTGSENVEISRWTTSDRRKSVYDPCPPGWRVPDGGDDGVWCKAFGIENTFQVSESEFGLNFSGKLGPDTIWYPYAGYIFHLSGSLFCPNSDASYWSATNSGGSQYFRKFAEALHFSTYKTVFPSTWEERATGASVRCVKE